MIDNERLFVCQVVFVGFWAAAPKGVMSYRIGGFCPVCLSVRLSVRPPPIRPPCLQLCLRGLQLGYRGLQLGLRGLQSGLRGFQLGLRGFMPCLRGLQPCLSGPPARPQGLPASP